MKAWGRGRSIRSVFQALPRARASGSGPISEKFDIQSFIDRQPLHGLHFTVLFLCSFTLFLDGFDIFLLGKIAPAIAADYGQPVEAMTTVFVSQQIGLAIGAFAIGPMADRLGRASTLVFCAAIFGPLTLAIPFAQTLGQIAFIRGVSGLFLGGLLPVALALIAESTPKRRRATFLSIAMGGFSLGSAAGAAVAAWLIDSFGWGSGFVMGGLLPLIIAPAIYFLVPESLPFRTKRNAADPKITSTLKRFQPDLRLSGDEIFVLREGRRKEAGRGHLFDVFREGRGRPTLLLWAATFLSMGNIALMASWMPSFFQDMAGVPIQDFAKAAVVAVIGGFAGSLSVGWFMDRFAPTSVLIFLFAANALLVTTLGTIGFNSVFFVAVLVCWQYAQSGGQAGLNAFLAQYYPTAIRSTGFSWAGGAGRIGGVIAPVIGGAALGAHLDLATTFRLLALIPLGVVAALIALGLILHRQKASTLLELERRMENLAREG